MAWAWPVERISTSMVVDAEEFNSNLAVYVAEIDGNISEHNLQRAAFQELMDDGLMADDVAMRIYNDKDEMDPHVAKASRTVIPQSLSWVDIPGTPMTIVTPGGQLFVEASFQYSNGTFNSDQPGCNFCLGLDGQPMMNTLLGTGDEGNEYVNVGFNAPDSQYAFDSGPAFRSRQMPLLVKGRFNVPPGQHTISLMARNLIGTPDDSEQYMTNFEMITLFLWS